MLTPTRIVNLRGLVLLALPACIVAVAACSGESKPPPVKPEVSAAPPPKPAPTPEEPEEPPPAETATPDAGPPPPPPPAQERPPVLLSDEKELRTVVSSSPGAKFEIGDEKGRAIFRIREGALPSAYIFTFKLDPKAKTKGLAAGPTYRLLVEVENSSDKPKLDTLDKPFEFTFPLGKRKAANLAIGELTVNDKGIEKLNWTVVAPEKTDESMNTAFFKLKSVGNFIMHMTAQAPTEPPASE